MKKSTLATAIASTCIFATNDASAERLIEEITVTATAREQSMQEIPYNISAVTGKDLEAAGISNETDLLRALSGATVADRGERNSGTVNSITVRGVNLTGGNEGDNNLHAIGTVATYVDNTPLYAGFVLRDLNRVELLRGPQGTLYGSGALGGAVRFISNKPNPEQFEGNLRADIGQTEHSDGVNQNYDIMLNIPLADNIALRGHAGRIDNDGIIDLPNAYRLNSFGEPLVNTALNASGDCIDPRTATATQVLDNPPCLQRAEDVDTVETNYARIALRFQPSEELTLSLAYQTQDLETGGRRAQTTGAANNAHGIPGYEITYGEAEAGVTALEPSERDVDLVSFDIEWDLGFATLTSSTSRSDDFGVGTRDQAGIYTSLRNPIPDESDNLGQSIYVGTPRTYATTDSGYERENLIQEFRLISNSNDSSLEWVIGAFYQEEDALAFNDNSLAGLNLFHEACLAAPGADRTMPATLPVNCQNFWPVVGFFGIPTLGPYGTSIDENDFTYRRSTEYEELAIYGELTYHLTEQLSITGGIRYFDNEQAITGIGGFPTSAAVFGPPEQLIDEVVSEDDVLFKANLAYDISEELMAYATVSQGYRRGGANALQTSGGFVEFGNQFVLSYTSDTVDNYELGLKGQFQKFSFSIAAFYVDWNDPQLNTAAAAFGFLYAANGDSAHTEGFESEITGLISDNWSYNLSYTYTTGELDEDFASLQPITMAGQDPVVIAPAGTKLPQIPEHVFSAALNGRWELSSDKLLSSQLSLYYQDDQKNILQDVSRFTKEIDSFWLLGASVSLVIQNNWQVTVYGSNLTDEEAITSSLPETQYSSDIGIDNSWYGNGSYDYIGQPRTLGVRVGYSF